MFPRLELKHQRGNTEDVLLEQSGADQLRAEWSRWDWTRTGGTDQSTAQLSSQRGSWPKGCLTGLLDCFIIEMTHFPAVSQLYCITIELFAPNKVLSFTAPQNGDS